MGTKASLGWDNDSKVGTVSDKEMASGCWLALKRQMESVREDCSPDGGSTLQA